VNELISTSGEADAASRGPSSIGNRDAQACQHLDWAYAHGDPGELESAFLQRLATNNSRRARLCSWPTAATPCTGSAGWLAYAGPEEPFPQDLTANLAAIGCDAMPLR